MNKRIYSLDSLRIICALLIICIHCPIYSYKDYILPICRIGVPIFFIISGYFLYSKDKVQTKIHIKRSIIKISKVYIFSLILFFIYSLINSINTNDFSSISIGPWKLFIFITQCSSLFFPYDYHLWFLIALIQGLILFYTIRKSILKHTSIFFLVSLIFISLNPIIKNLDINILNKIHFIPFSQVLFISFPYLIIGYYLHLNHDKILQTSYKQIILYIALILFIITSILEGIKAPNQSNYYSTLFLSLTVFCIFNSFTNQSNKIIYYTAKLGEKYSLYIYIGHVIIIHISQTLYNTTNPIFIFVISLLCSYSITKANNLYRIFKSIKCR